MGFFSKKKAQPVQEKKSSKLPSYFYSLYDSYGGDLFAYSVYPRFAYNLYHSIGPLKTAVSMITDEIQALPLVLKDKSDNDKVIRKSPIIDILENPNENTTKEEFWADLSRSIELVNEMWLIAIGDTNREPISIEYAHPYDITIFKEAGEIWPYKIQHRYQSTVRTFYREVSERSVNRYRYIDKAGFAELFPIIYDQSVGSDFRAANPLTGLKDELLSYKSSTATNKSQLEKSIHPSGIFGAKTDDIDEENIKFVEEALEKFRGEDNAGKIMYLPAALEAIDVKWAPKDMNYKELRDDIRENLWNHYKIPLPLMSSESQTYSNFSEARWALYDLSISPKFTKMASGLKWALETRYDFNNLYIAYDELEIPALKERAISNMKKRSETGAFTTDENRATAGMKPVSGGGEVMVSASMTTLENATKGLDFGTDTGTE